MNVFRGGTAAELIPFHLDDGEDLVETLARMAEELNLGVTALAMGSGALASACLVTAVAPGPVPLGVVAEYQGPLPIVTLQGWILAGQPEVQLTLSRGGTLIAAQCLALTKEFESNSAGKTAALAAIGIVAEQLGNTVAICRKCYIHPAVIEAFTKEESFRLWQKLSTGTAKEEGLGPEESMLLRYLSSWPGGAADRG